MKKKEDIKEIKKRIVFIIALMFFMLAFCYTMYSGKNPDLVRTKMEILEKDNAVSLRLQEIIPFVPHTLKDTVSAYQNKKITYSEIDNDIYLMKAYTFSENKNPRNFSDTLQRLYGNNLFIINKDFDITGNISCKLDTKNENYNCYTSNYEGIIYDAAREVLKLAIDQNDYTLREQVIFYSKEKNNDEFLYKIYTDSTYSEEVASFTSKELDDEVLMNNYEEYKVTYESAFVINGNTYEWISTKNEMMEIWNYERIYHG